MDVLGVTSASGGFHDSSVVWVRDGVIQLALSEERLSRIKHDSSFPRRSIELLLRRSGLGPADFAGVAVAWKPYNAFSGFFRRSLFDVPLTGVVALARAPRLSLDYLLNNFLRKKVLPAENNLPALGFRPGQIHFFSHHLAHAASSYRTSGFERALSVNLDCFGPDDQGHLWSGAAFICEGNDIQLLEYVPPYASLGLFYSALSVCLGFRFGDGEGKTMGLAAYGDPARAYSDVRRVAPRFRDSRWHGHPSWTDFRLIDNPQLMFRTRWGRYLRGVIAETSREDVAAAAQRILEEELTRYFDYLLRKTGLRDIVLAGGIFLNVTFNRRLAERPDVSRIFVHPFPSDGGTAAGAALELHARMTGQAVSYELSSAALGIGYTEQEVTAAFPQYGGRISVETPSDIARATAGLLADGKIVGWFQGREEWGPRALGYRSVLGDPRAAGTKERLNALLKCRDWFMPFAPSILEEHAEEYLENSFYAPFMTFSFNVREERKELAPQIIHRDGTARPNVVRQSVNPLYYRMISAFRDITGVPIVLNTSFNRHGLPLVHTPEHAIDHLLWGCVDVLAIGSHLVRRSGAVEPPDSIAVRAQEDAYVDSGARQAASGHA